MKKQAFLEKIQRELKEKEKSNLIKKKVAAQQALNNIDDLMVINSDEESEYQKARKKHTQTVKKIYPVSICFHQKSKLLAISLIDCDIKVYQIKSSGSSI